MINIIYRTYPVVVDDKPRPNWFTKERCFNSIVNKISDHKAFKLHILFNGEKREISNRPELAPHETKITYIKGNTAAESYLGALDYACNLSEVDWVYLVEDDYLHHPNWTNILLNMTHLDTYFTLYDHPDKYTQNYKGLTSELIYANNVLCRTIPSTTDTFCVPVNMLKEDYAEHKLYSTDVPYSLDHERFANLHNKGRKVYSPIPGYSVHCHNPWCNVREDYFD